MNAGIFQIFLKTEQKKTIQIYLNPSYVQIFENTKNFFLSENKNTILLLSNIHCLMTDYGKFKLLEKTRIIKNKTFKMFRYFFYLYFFVSN